MRVQDGIHESASRWKDDSHTAEKYRRIKYAFDVLVADEIRQGKFHNEKQIEGMVAKSGAILAERSSDYDETHWVDRSILDEIAGEFMAGQRAHQERAVLGDLASVGELFGREYAEQNKKCEMTEATLTDVYEKCKQLLSRKVRPDLMGILDDIYLGTLAKLRLRLVRVYGDFTELEDRAESTAGYEMQDESIEQKVDRTRINISLITDKGIPKKSTESRAVQIQDDISQTDVTFAGCKDSIAHMRGRLDGEEFRRMAPSTKEHLEELSMALDKKTAFTGYYRNKAHERLEQGDVASANLLAGTFREMARSLQDDAQRLTVMLDRYAGNRASREPEPEQSTPEEISKRTGEIFNSEQARAKDLFDKLTQRHDELSALKAIDNPDDERRRTAYLIDLLMKEENSEKGRRMHGIIIDTFTRAQEDAKRVISLSHELRRKNEERIDLVAQKKLAADYAKAIRAYSDSVQELSDNVGRLNDAYLSLFPEAL
ncbi:MAG: hypothetical protein Q8P56_01660 [Candidatus Uhrbacteria bacterium]|nr:hypothetical protein [Candidatus Uhrbacteria bacterium]